MRVVFDLDGTLADTAARELLAAEAAKAGPEAKQAAWDAFHAGIPNDHPVKAVKETLVALYEYGHAIDIWTARPEKYREVTEQWLDKHHILYNELRMRQDGDFRPSPILKLQWYFSTYTPKPTLVFEDHPETVKLLRDAGVTVANMGNGRNHTV